MANTTLKPRKAIHLPEKKRREATIPSDDIQTGDIDAVLLGDYNTTSVFTENSADKIFRILIEKMTEGAVALSTDEIIVYCNAAFAAMVAQPLQQIVGKPFKSFIDPSSRKHFDKLFQLSSQDAATEQLFLKTNKIGRLPVLISVNSIASGSTDLVNIILTDISSQIEQQEALQEKTEQLEQNLRDLDSANKDLVSFSHVSSHDLQEPLRKIQNFISRLLLEEQANFSDNGKRYLQGISATAKGMKLLIEDLLDYAEASHSDRKFERIDLAALVKSVVADFGDIIATKNAAVDFARLGTAIAIPFQFRQVLQNLIGNSLKFASPTRPVIIKITSRKVKMDGLHAATKGKINYLHIVYTDNGIGFDPRHNEQIFDVFERLHARDKFAGTGIGLAICKRIIENHNGYITATGKPAKGARFDIYLPEKQPH